ncbi:hypothetical protein DH2020_049577 [Rehmannia glutinosa]|uniref:Protein kinase domain-containing protein n=1 Tax=Rehmannia glutinosa TaxID=99300 RepID=A0ABR0U3L2_REHGL
MACPLTEWPYLFSSLLDNSLVKFRKHSNHSILNTQDGECLIGVINGGKGDIVSGIYNVAERWSGEAVVVGLLKKTMLTWMDITMMIHALQTVILIFALITPISSTLSINNGTLSKNFPIAKPNCVDSCGDVRISFPFGTTKDCYESYSFFVTCNKTFNPPKLFWQDTDIEFTDISLHGQLKLMQFVARDCYDRNGSWLSGGPTSVRLIKFFTVNNTANKFTIVGCDTYGFISGRRLGSRSYTSTGCTAMCGAKDDVAEGLCQGLGCCQTFIPGNVWNMDIDLGSYRDYVNVSDFNTCGYAFLVEEAAFRFSADNFTTLWNVRKLPIVVDWAFGNGTCKEANSSSSDYICKSLNSECYDPSNGTEGYRCRCYDGYQGNPRLRLLQMSHLSGLIISTPRWVEAQSRRSAGLSLSSSLLFFMYCFSMLITSEFGVDRSVPVGGGRDGAVAHQKDRWETQNLGSSVEFQMVKMEELDFDINECEVPGPSKCKYDCVNTPGGFDCPCPKGYKGNGTIGGEGCHRARGESVLMLRLVAGVSLGIIVLLLAVCWLYLELKRRKLNKNKKTFFLQNGGILLQQKLNKKETSSSDTAKIFSSSELHKATNNFHNSMIIGQGGYGTVYKGYLPDNRIVAIKKSKKVDPTQIDQFVNEVIVLSQINHRNVVKLLGCCLETEVPLLVYEFISNGTLSAHLHSHNTKARFLNWEMRLRIAADTAGVLSYLHSSASIPIIHRDVKTDNILLDHTFTAKVSDFGASKLVPLDHTQLSTMVQGTFGYLDPEYMQTNQLTEKSDVYSFGVVLLELLTGRRAISFDKPENEKNLANFFLSVLKQERLLHIVDDNIVDEGDNYKQQMIEVGMIAQGCLYVRGDDRPTMKEVAMELERLIRGGKHAWARNEHDLEEMEFLLGDQKLDGFGNGDGNCVSIGYDSLRGHVILPMNGGR